MDILERLKHWSDATPDRPAHISGGRSLGYRELDTASNRLAGHLLSTLQPDHAPVAVLGHKEPEMLVAFLAAIKSGHPYIPIDDSLPHPRVQSILNTSAAALTLTPAGIQELLKGTATVAQERTVYQPKPSDPWYIIFTSGSTGEPKGVVITTGCLESFVEWMLQEQKPVEQAEVFLNQAPFSFDLSVMDLYLSLATGGTLFSLRRDEIAEAARLYEVLLRSQVSIWVSTPSFARLCLAEPTFRGNRYPGLRKFLFCGETLAPEVASELLGRFPQAEVWNTYGPTEATCATTSVQIDREVLQHYSPLPVGFPKPDSQVVVLNSQGQVAAPGERGEIVIAGPNVSPGYLARPELTRRAFFEYGGAQAYHTGDWGHTQDGLIFFDGRMDNQVKLHGYRIELGDVEAHLCRLEEIKDAVVLPVLKGGAVDQLAAFVILKNPAASTGYETVHRLRTALGQDVPAYMIPRRITILAQFPMTANGKADRRRLAERLK